MASRVSDKVPIWFTLIRIEFAIPWSMPRWKIAGCEEPSGLALDRKNRRLFAGCGGNKKMAVVDADSGKVVAMLDIGDGCDGTAFDPDQKLAFASAGDGTITVIREDSPDKFGVASCSR